MSISDWSSDVCSSDLLCFRFPSGGKLRRLRHQQAPDGQAHGYRRPFTQNTLERQPATVRLGEALAQRPSKPGAFVVAAQTAVELSEGTQRDRDLLWPHSNAVVGECPGGSLHIETQPTLPR